MSKPLGAHQAAIDISQVSSAALLDLSKRAVKGKDSWTLDKELYGAVTAALQVIRTRSIYIAANTPSTPAHKQEGPPICETCD